MIVNEQLDINILENNLNINVDNRTFKTLIDGIYTDKLSSVIREIGVNAKDSHILAGNTNPYNIALMVNSFEVVTEIYFKDEGVGLSREEAEQYLCTLNSSSKRGDNTQTGFFGIGSKSPYSIADTFEYVCVKDGKKTLISFLRIEDSTPQYDIKDLGNTSEPNGVFCRISLQEDYQLSVDKFLASINKYLLLFPVQPKVFLVDEETKEKREVLLDKVEEFEDFFIVWFTDDSNKNSSFVSVEGSVLSLEKLSRSFVSDYFYYAKDYSFIPKVKYGVLTFGEGREVIENTPSNQREINSLVASLNEKYFKPEDINSPAYIEISLVRWSRFFSNLFSYSICYKVLFQILTGRFKDSGIYTSSNFHNVLRNVHWRSELYLKDGDEILSEDTKFIWLNTSIKSHSYSTQQNIRNALPSNTLLLITSGGKDLYQTISRLGDLDLRLYNIKELRKDYSEIANLYSPLESRASSDTSETQLDPFDRVKLDFIYHHKNSQGFQTVNKNLTYKQFIKDFNRLMVYGVNLYFVSKQICSSEDIKTSFLDILKGIDYQFITLFEFEIEESYSLLAQRSSDINMNIIYVEDFFVFLKETKRPSELYNSSLLRSYLKALDDFPSIIKASSYSWNQILNHIIVERHTYKDLRNYSISRFGLYQIAVRLKPFLVEDLEEYFTFLPEEYKDIVRLDKFYNLFESEFSDDN